MADPQVAPTQDDLASRLQAVSQTSPQGDQTQAAPQAGDDLQSRLHNITGTTPVKMVGPDGAQTKVTPDQVADMRQKNFAVAQDNPNAVKMVSPKGQVTYVLPTEQKDFQTNGFTWVHPDGSFDLQNIAGEDPLEEEKRRERVFQALTPQEKHNANKTALKEFGKAGVEATIDTAAGVAGAGGLSASLEAAGPAASNFARQVGTEVVKKYAGQTTAKITADLLVKGAGTVGLGWLAKLGWSLTK